MASVLVMLALVASMASADPETVEGLVKRSGKEVTAKKWQIPVLAHQPNENKPAEGVGKFPGLEPDTLARPLKTKQGT
jgi:hypothetical protein